MCPRGRLRHVMGADRIARAETQFLGTVRGDAGGEFTIKVSLSAGRWAVQLLVPGRAGAGATGQGPSFAYAWTHDLPWWQEPPPDAGKAH